jgi:hypothetical protein
MAIYAAMVALFWAPYAAAHEHHPPHGGSLQVFGEEAAHLELVLDAEEGRLTAYALDGEAEGPVRLAQRAIRLKMDAPASKGGAYTLTLKAVANPLTGETIGATSQFEAVSPRLKGLKSFEGTFQAVTLRGFVFRGVRARYPQGNE